MAYGDLLEEGRVVKYMGRVWFIGLVNASRARLDPLTAVGAASPVTGKSFQTYGSSINVANTSDFDDFPIEDLDDIALGRLCRLQEQRELENARGHSTRQVVQFSDEGEGEDMATATTVKGGTAAAAPLPVPTRTTSADRRKAATATLTKGAAPKAAKAKGPVSRDNACKCGCGEMTSKHFVPGHDARFKGWMLKIERGQAKKTDLLTAEVIKAYKWVKTESGERTTTNYKGEAHNGYAAK